MWNNQARRKEDRAWLVQDILDQIHLISVWKELKDKKPDLAYEIDIVIANEEEVLKRKRQALKKLRGS